MGFNKIQPEQCEPRITYSNSGDIKIYSTDTGLSLDLSRGLTGDFAITGSLTLNKRPLFPLADTTSNIYDTSSGAFVINNTLNDVRAEEAFVVNSVGLTMSGTRNIALNGTSQSFESGTLGCMGIGNALIFPELTTGSVILTDSQNSITTAVKDDYLDINFLGGTYIHGGDAVIGSDFYTDESHSGLFSGNLSVIGYSFLTGYVVSTIHDVTGMLSGENFVNVGAVGSEQTIIGQKKFTTGLHFQLPYARDVFFLPAAEVQTGQLAMSGDQLLFKTENGDWTGVALTGIH